MIFLLQVLNITMLVIGIQFIINEYRSKLNKVLLIVGYVIALLSLFNLFDCFLYSLPLEKQVYFLNIQHIFFLPLPLLVVQYVIILTRYELVRSIPIPFTEIKTNHFETVYISSFIVLTGLFAGNEMFVFKNGIIDSTIFYDAIFSFYLSSALLFSCYLSIFRFKKVSKNERRIIITHLLGFTAVIISGSLDLMDCFNEGFNLSINYLIYGQLIYSIMMSYIASDFQKMIVEENKRIGIELVKTRQLAEMGESVALITHNIKNYAATIRWIAGHLKEKKEAFPGSVNTIVEDLSLQADKQFKLVNDLLLFAKSTVVRELHSVDILKMISGIIDSTYTDKKDFFVLSCNPPQIIACVNEMTFGDIFINLFNNSLEADATKIEVDILKTDSLAITVKDNGKGILHANRDIFEKFYTTKKEKGTGLGLPIVRKIIESHGGTISYTARNGNKTDSGTGLVFTIEFPPDAMLFKGR